MGKVVYISRSRIERKQGPLRVAHLPGEYQPVVYSVHGAIAEHYQMDPAKLTESHSSTIDYVISATAGWMLGTFGSALEARHIDASDGKLTADVIGAVEEEEGVLVIRRIHVAMRLAAPDEARRTIERIHGLYAMSCPLYRTLHKAINSPPRSNWCDKSHLHISRRFWRATVPKVMGGEADDWHMRTPLAWVILQLECSENSVTRSWNRKAQFPRPGLSRHG